jgi:hypothetical protein
MKKATFELWTNLPKLKASLRLTCRLPALLMLMWSSRYLFQVSSYIFFLSMWLFFVLFSWLSPRVAPRRAEVNLTYANCSPYWAISPKLSTCIKLVLPPYDTDLYSTSRRKLLHITMSFSIPSPWRTSSLLSKSRQSSVMSRESSSTSYIRAEGIN